MTYCDPEVASVGLTEEAARAELGDVETVTYDLTGNGKSQILKTAGFVKLVRAAGGPVVGVHLVGARVGELIGEAQLITGLGRVRRGGGAPRCTPIRRRTRRSARPIWPWPASRSTRTDRTRATTPWIPTVRTTTHGSARTAARQGGDPQPEPSRLG